MTIIPTFQDGVLFFGVDSLSLQTFDRILKDVTSKHKLIDQKFYVGGFSIGGSCAIKYAGQRRQKTTAILKAKTYSLIILIGTLLHIVGMHGSLPALHTNNGGPTTRGRNQRGKKCRPTNKGKKWSR